LLCFQPWDKVNWFPLRVYRIFLQNRNLGWLAVALFLLGFAVGSINVLQGFVVRSYGWSNAESIYVFVLALAVLAVSCVCGPVVISSVGTHTTLKIGISLVVGGFCVLIFAQAAPVLVYIGVLIMAAGGFASPAFLTIISSLAHHSDQGLLQGAVNSVVLLSSGIGSAVHSATFSWARTTSVGASLPFLVSAICVAVALAITVWVLRALQRGRRGSDSGLPFALNAQVLLPPSMEMVPTSPPRTTVQPTDLEPFHDGYDASKLPVGVVSEAKIEPV
jgi:MFS family permease